MIKGFMKSSFVDYPGRVCSVIFIGGCNFRCPYCHNPEIVFSKTDTIPFDQVLKYLQNRKRVVESVCITGGEPLLWKELPLLVKKLKQHNFSIKIDTNGINPTMLSQLINSKSVDFISMDIKAPLKKYEKVTKVSTDIDKICDSIKLIMNSGVGYEFRTTVHSELLNRQDILRIAEELRGAKRLVLQEFKFSRSLIDSSYLGKNTFSRKELENLQKEIKSRKLVAEIEVR